MKLTFFVSLCCLRVCEESKFPSSFYAVTQLVRGQGKIATEPEGLTNT